MIPQYSEHPTAFEAPNRPNPAEAASVDLHRRVFEQGTSVHLVSRHCALHVNQCNAL